MITQDGAIQVQTKLDGKLFRQYSKKYFIIWSIVLALSALFIVAQVLCAIFDKELFSITLTVCAVVLGVCSLFLIIIMARAVKKADKKNNRSVCDLYADYMQVCGYENDVKVSEVKIYYNTLFKREEIKDYFLAFASKSVFYPISKQGLTPAELTAVRRLLNNAGANPQYVQNSGASSGYAPPPQTGANANSAENVFEDFPESGAGNRTPESGAGNITPESGAQNNGGNEGGNGQ